MFDLYLITAELPPSAIVARARQALAGVEPGRVALQLRAGHLPEPELRGLAQELRALTSELGAPLIINADPELARALPADGVQLKERGPSIAAARACVGRAQLIGASRHDQAGVHAAAADGADFVTLSPVFEVSGKGAPLGIDGFAAIAHNSPLKVIALGGVGIEHTAALIAAGAHGIAVIRAVFDHPRPVAATRELLAAIDRGRAQRAAG